MSNNKTRDRIGQSVRIWTGPKHTVSYINESSVREKLQLYSKAPYTRMQNAMMVITHQTRERRSFFLLEASSKTTSCVAPQICRHMAELGSRFRVHAFAASRQPERNSPREVLLAAPRKTPPSLHCSSIGRHQLDCAPAAAEGAHS